MRGNAGEWHVGDRFTNLWSRLRGGVKGPLGPTAITLGDGVVVDGRFAVKGLLGIGGTSAVYVAEQTSMGRDVALKILRSELISREQATDRFVREVRAISRLNNPHTVSVYDVGRTPEGLLFIAMELLRGRSLFQVMSDEPGPMPAWRAVQIVDQVLESLAEAHASGVLHRDLKPENIFLVEGSTAKEFAKVLDFGIAQLGDETDLQTEPRGMVVGTPRYMSPEQMSGKPLDARSDLYSLATVLFEMLSGHAPFEAPTPLALGLRKIREKAPTLREVNPTGVVPEEIQMFLERALATLPEDRYATATEFRNLLALAVEGHEPDPASLRAVEPARRTGNTRYAPRPKPAPPEPPPPPRPADRRTHGRAARMMKVRFRMDGVDHKATSTDVGRGGAFFASRAVPAVGARIEIAVLGSSGETTVARTLAEVVRVVEVPGGPTEVRGFAVRWLPADQARPAVSVDDLIPGPGKP
jgi:serine/threonine-protein kinase